MVCAVPDKIRIKPHPVQAAFLRDPARIRVFVGGIGAGKSFVGAVAVLTMPAKSSVLVVAPTWRILKDATIPSFLSVAERFVQEYRRSELLMRLTNGTTVRFRTAERPDVLRGINASAAWIDEAAHLPSAEVFEILIGRLRLAPGRCWLTTTPKGLNWLYDLTLESDVAVYHASTRDNTSLPDTFFDFVRSRYTSELAAQELEGQFIDIGGSGLFERQWFRLQEHRPPGLQWYRYWDLAVSVKRHGDFTASARVAIDRQGIVYLADLWQQKTSWPLVKRKIIELAVKEQADTAAIGLETIAGFEIGYSELLEESALQGHTVRSIKPHRDKAARAAPLAARAEAGKVVLIRDRFSDVLLSQATMFPDTKHDDLIDAAAGALAMCAGSTARLVVDKTKRGKLAW